MFAYTIQTVDGTLVTLYAPSATELLDLVDDYMRRLSMTNALEAIYALPCADVVSSSDTRTDRPVPEG